jgi:hypothetical protein
MLDAVDTDVDGLPMAVTGSYPIKLFNEGRFFMPTDKPQDEVTRLMAEEARSPIAPVTSVRLDQEDTFLDPSKSAFLETEPAATEPEPALDPDPLTRAETAGELRPVAFPESGCVVAFNDGTFQTVAVAFVEIVTVDGAEMTLSELRDRAVGFFRAPSSAQADEYVWQPPIKKG